MRHAGEAQRQGLHALDLLVAGYGSRLVRVAPQDRRTIADDALLPTRLLHPLLSHLAQQGAIVAGTGSRFAPADPAAREFIAEGGRRARLASAKGQRAASARPRAEL